MNAESVPHNEILKTTPDTGAVEFRDALPTPETLAILGDKKAAYDIELDTLAASKEATTSQLTAVRQKLGLPPLMKIPPSLQYIEEKMQQIEEEKNKAEEKHAKLLSEQQEELLLKIEKTRLMNEKISELRQELSSLDEQVKTAIITTGMIPNGVIFKSLVDVPPHPEEIRRWFALAMSEKDALGVNAIENSESLEGLSKSVEKEAAENVTTAIDHLEKQAVGGLTETDLAVLKEADELLIGYEGDSYTPESLLKHIEEQNKAEQSESVDAGATKDVAATYNPNTQAN